MGVLSLCNCNVVFGSEKWLANGLSQGVLTKLRGDDFKGGFIGVIVGGFANSVGAALTCGMRTGMAIAEADEANGCSVCEVYCVGDRDDGGCCDE